MRSSEDQRLNPVGVAKRELLGHHPTEREPVHVDALDSEAMADDAVSILDDLAIERVHVYGFSLGGMVAQQLALRHPDRVQSLVLGGTHSGGRRAAVPDAEVMAFFRRRATMPAEEAAWASVPFNYGPRSQAE